MLLQVKPLFKLRDSWNLNWRNSFIGLQSPDGANPAVDIANFDLQTVDALILNKACQPAQKRRLTIIVSVPNVNYQHCIKMGIIPIKTNRYLDIRPVETERHQPYFSVCRHFQIVTTAFNNALRSIVTKK
jgi:hypothetical protein